jgi:hypothetical protein
MMMIPPPIFLVMRALVLSLPVPSPLVRWRWRPSPVSPIVSPSLLSVAPLSMSSHLLLSVIFSFIFTIISLHFGVFLIDSHWGRHFLLVNYDSRLLFDLFGCNLSCRGQWLVLLLPEELMISIEGWGHFLYEVGAGSVFWEGGLVKL